MGTSWFLSISAIPTRTIVHNCRRYPSKTLPWHQALRSLHLAEVPKVRQLVFAKCWETARSAVFEHATESETSAWPHNIVRLVPVPSRVPRHRRAFGPDVLPPNPLAAIPAGNRRPAVQLLPRRLRDAIALVRLAGATSRDAANRQTVPVPPGTAAPCTSAVAALAPLAPHAVEGTRFLRGPTNRSVPGSWTADPGCGSLWFSGSDSTTPREVLVSRFSLVLQRRCSAIGQSI